MFSSTKLSFDSLFAITVSTAAIVSAKDSQTDEQKAKSNHYVPRRLKGRMQEVDSEAMSLVDLIATLETIIENDANDVVDHVNEEVLTLGNSVKKSRQSKEGAFEANDHDARQLSLDTGILSSNSNIKGGNRTKRYLKVGKGTKKKKAKGTKKKKAKGTKKKKAKRSKVGNESSTSAPSFLPSALPSTSPSASASPSNSPSAIPSALPSVSPSALPSALPSAVPSLTPSASPSDSPSAIPSDSPSLSPSALPSASPSALPSALPSLTPSASPSDSPSAIPSGSPSLSPSALPSASPSALPSALPSLTPSASPSDCPKTSVDVVVQYDGNPRETFWGIEKMNGDLVDFGTGFFTPFGIGYQKKITTVGGLCSDSEYTFWARDMYSDGLSAPSSYLSVVQGGNEIDRISGSFTEKSFTFTPSLEFPSASPSSAPPTDLPSSIPSSAPNYVSPPPTSCDYTSFEVIIGTGEKAPRALWWDAFVFPSYSSLNVQTGIYGLENNAETSSTVNGCFDGGDSIFLSVCNGYGDDAKGISVTVKLNGDKLLEESVAVLFNCFTTNNFIFPNGD